MSEVKELTSKNFSPSETAGRTALPVFVLKLEAYEGPLDLLLALARQQKVDLAHISVLDIALQYLEIFEKIREEQPELAADWLVMAAFLTRLKSGLLLPPEENEEEAAEALLDAEILAERLEELAFFKRAAKFLTERPRLGTDIFLRGSEDDLICYEQENSYSLSFAELIGARIRVEQKRQGQKLYRPQQVRLWTMHEAYQRLNRLLKRQNSGTEEKFLNLRSFLPDFSANSFLEQKAATASFFAAVLELTRHGEIAVRQDDLFADIFIAAKAGSAGRS